MLPHPFCLPGSWLAMAVNMKAFIHSPRKEMPLLRDEVLVWHVTSSVATFLTLGAHAQRGLL